MGGDQKEMTYREPLELKNINFALLSLVRVFLGNKARGKYSCDQ